MPEVKCVCAAQTELGRDLQGKRWGPRPLDLDIIFYEGLQHREEGLEIPHPRWQERPFVQVILMSSLSDACCDLSICRSIRHSAHTSLSDRSGSLYAHEWRHMQVLRRWRYMVKCRTEPLHHLCRRRWQICFPDGSLSRRLLAMTLGAACCKCMISGSRLAAKEHWAQQTSPASCPCPNLGPGHGR